MSPALEGSQQLIRTSTELQPYRPQIGNMVEPWRLSETELADARIIYPEMEHKGVAEAFRAIRTSIVQQHPAGNCTVLVTSAVEDAERRVAALRTIEAVARHLSFSRAAEELRVHVNTVTQRLERVGRLLGRDWSSPERALEVQLALRLYRLTGAVED